MRLLRLPKTVRISNVRLNVVYLVLVTFTWIIIIMKFINQREYIHRRSGSLASSLWPNGFSNATAVQNHYQKSLNRPHCKNHYRYKYDEEYKYNVTGCAGPAWAAAYKQENDWNLLFPTHVQKTHPNTTEERFTTSIDIAGIGLQYSFQDEGKLGQHSFHYTSSRDITTVFIDGKGKEQRIEPGQPLGLTMVRIFELAGFSNLDSINPDAAAIGATSTHTAPIYRLSGLQLDLVAECNPQFGFWSFFNVWTSVRTQMKCDIRVQKSARNWIYVTGQRDHDANGNPFTVTFHGVRVAFSQLKVEEISFSQIIESIADAFILLSIPVMFMEFVSVHLLGALSPIYRQATSEPFSIQKEVGSMVVRLIAMSAIFVDLQDESGCISRKRCQERLTVLFNNEKDLSPDEVDSIAEYCYTSVVTNTVHEYQGFHHAVNKVIEGMQRGDKTGKYSDACSAKGIDSATFSAACGSLEKISFRQVVHLFDWERKHGCLERLFMPKDLYVALHCHKKHVKQIRASGERAGSSFFDASQSMTAEESLTNCLTLEERKDKMLKKIFTADHKIVGLEKLQAEIQNKHEDHRRVLDGLQQELKEKMQQLEVRLDTDSKKITGDTSREGTTASKDNSRQHRTTTQDVLAMCRVVEACNTECNMLNKSLESVLTSLASMDERLQGVEEVTGFDTNSACPISPSRESKNSLGPVLEPEATDETVRTTVSMTGGASSVTAGVKVSAITHKALAEKVENICFRLSVIEEFAESRIGIFDASSFAISGVGNTPPLRPRPLIPKDERASGGCLQTPGRWREC